MIATVSEIAEIAPWAFLLGFGIGFVVGARFRISKRDDDYDEPTEEGTEDAKPERGTTRRDP